MKRVILLITVFFALTIFSQVSVSVVTAANMLSGKIKDVDIQEQSLVIGLKEQDKVVYLDSQTKIVKNGQSASLANLKVGMLVSINTITKDGETLAKNITISP